MKLKRNVVMLPTNDKANLFINNINSPLLYDNNSTLHRVLLRGRYQHIYITSDEEIKEGDWYYDPFDSKIRKALSNIDSHSIFSNCKKIIATTDNLTFDDGYNSWFIPSPSDGFIKKFIEKYNAGTSITEVMVEYEEWPVLERITGTEASFRTVVKKLLKVDKNNCITITAVKESWTRKEVIAFAKKYAKRAQATINPGNKWIEENL